MRTKLICIATAMSLPLCAQTIYIQPLGKVHQQYVDTLVTGIKSFYHTDVIVRSPVALTPDLLAASKTRYEASKILSKFDSKDEVVLITEKDIVCKNPERHSSEWGIFGLGHMPGHVCVISTYRIRGCKDPVVIRTRFIKICLHEIGHNCGLPHCNTDGCMMSASDGTMAELDRESIWFCNSCTSKLKSP